MLGGWLLTNGALLVAAPADPGKPAASANTAAAKQTEDKPAAKGSGDKAAGGDPAKTPAVDAGDAAATPPADTAPPAPLRNPPLRLEVRRNQPLAKQIEGMEGAEGNPLWLGDKKDPFLGLYIESYVGAPRGAVLLLHDNEQHPDWPGMLHELRVSFPHHGWSTLSIALPDFRPIPPMLPPLPKDVPVATPPAGDNAGTATGDKKDADEKAAGKDTAQDKGKDKGKDADKEKTKDKKADINNKKDAADKKDAASKDAKKGDKPAEPEKPAEAPAQPAAPPAPEYLQRDSEIPVANYPQEIERRIKEATRYLINEGVQHVVIVAFGSTAGLAAHVSRNMLINELDGLVLMDPRPYPEARFDLPGDTADLRIPILDVVPEYEPATNPLLRKQATGRVQTPQYEMRLVRGAAVNFSGYEPYVFKAVRGWADTQFKNAPERKDRKQQAQKKRAEKASVPAGQAPDATPANPSAPQTPPPPKGTQPAPNLNEAIPPPVPG